MKKIYLIGLLILLIFPLSAQENSSKNIALLVGVNKYPNLPDKYQLKGCVNDAQMMNNLLTDVFQFKEENIRLLTDENATKEDILRAFDQFLLLNAERDGQVLFYFSGHGGQMFDLNFDEPDSLDESILPHDAHRDPTQEVKDISDDELSDLLDQLAEKCENITVIMDCCHSGSGTRLVGGDVPRQIDDVFNPLNVRHSPEQQSRQLGFSAPNENCVVITGCRDDQLAYEMRNFRDWLKPCGAMTFAFCQAVRKNPKATYTQIMHHVTEKVTARNRHQYPQLEGKRRDAKLFGDLGVVENYLEIQKVKGKKVQISGGAVHGVTVSSIYHAYKIGTMNTNENENYLGKIEIKEVDTFTSIGEIIDQQEKIEENSVVFEAIHNYGDLRLRVRLDLQNNLELKTQIENSLESEKSVKLVDENAKFDLNIRADSVKLFLENAGGFELTTLEMTEDNIQYKLPEILSKEAKLQNLYRLENRNTDLEVKLGLHLWEKLDADYNPVNELEIVEESGQNCLAQLPRYLSL